MVFESTPPAYSSVNDPLVYVCYDSNATDPITYPNYKYVGDLYIDAVLVFTARVFPHPDTSRGIFDFADVIREYVDTQLAPTSAGVSAQELVPGQWATKSIVVKISEEYGGTVGDPVLEDDPRVFFNHYNARFNNFTKLTPYAGKVATVRPTRNINILFSAGKYYIPYFAETTATIHIYFHCTTSGFDLDVAITPSVANTMQLFNIAPGAVNTDSPGYIGSAAESYIVTIGDGPPDTQTVYNVTILCPGRYANYFVHFLNSFGGFETMLFNKVRRRKLEIEKKTWRQLPYRVDAAGIVSVKTGDIMHPQATTFAARFKEGLKLSTDWLNDDEYVWLADLVASVIILIEDNGTLWYVTLSDTNYDYKENIVDSLTNLAIQADFGTTYKTQFQ